MSSPRFGHRLKFLPLGLLWGVIGGGFHTYHFATLFDRSPSDSEPEVIWPLILLMLLMMVGTCPIAILLGSVMLTHELSSIRWIFNWVITGVASSTGGVAIFWLIAALLMMLQGLHPVAFSNLGYVIGIIMWVIFSGVMGSLFFGILIAIESALVALLLAPLSLLVRWFMLRHVSAAESGGVASQTQP